MEIIQHQICVADSHNYGIFNQLLLCNLAIQVMRKRASTYTDGGMLWCVPPTSVTLLLRVEKSNSRHALETTQLRSTCILGKNTLPTRTERVFWAYAATVDSFPLLSRISKKKNEKKKGGGNQKSPMLSDLIVHCNVFGCRDADERCALAKTGRILSLCEFSKVPRCGPR